jgi:hypothetical protein
LAALVARYFAEVDAFNDRAISAISTEEKIDTLIDMGFGKTPNAQRLS